MKIHAITCQAIQRECYHAAAHSPHIVTVTVIPFGLHCEPEKLRATLQSEIDRASGGHHDAIVLSYGLCSRGTAQLAARDTKLVIARAHDCITLLLGSRGIYDREFSGHPGTYYYSSGWIEHVEGEVEQGDIVILKDKQTDQRFREYVERYGEENAAFLIEQENQWFSNYNRAALIESDLGDSDYYRRFTQQMAQTKGWAYEEIQGSRRLFDRLMSGDWNVDEFLVVEPGQSTFEDVNAGIIGAS